MKIHPKIGTWVTAVTIAIASSGATALTLGRTQGSVLLGRPLDVSVLVQRGIDEEVSSLCFEADVFFGDVRLESSKVTVSSGAIASELTLAVRIVTSVKVDEPVVSLELRSLCKPKTSRRYSLLVDLPSDSAPVSVATAVSPALRIDSSISPPVSTAPPTTSPAKSDKAQKPKSNVKDKAKAVKKGQERAGVGPRLKLLTVEPALERDLVLRSSSDLTISAMDNLEKRAEALAAWRALNASAEDVLRDEAKLRALETENKGLRDVAAKNSQALQEASERAAQAESERYMNPLVIALGALLLFSLLGLALLGRRLKGRTSQDEPWWRPSLEAVSAKKSQNGLLDDTSQVDTQVHKRGAMDVPENVQAPVADAKHSTTAVDIDLELGESVFSRIDKSVATSSVPVATGSESQKPEFVVPERRDFASSVAGTLRAINTKEMLDIRQQAEFFMTLGQYEEAIGVLESGIHGSFESNPLIYLDLLKVFHTLSRKPDFDRYRNEFNELFTGIVPVYEHFLDVGNPLEAYTQVCRQIADLWPSEDAVEYIENCLVRAPSDDPDQGFELEAFRDLLMLHGVARRLDSVSQSAVMPFSATRPSSPSAIGSAAQLPKETVQEAATEKPTGNLIDFDISGYDSAAPGESSEQPPKT